MRLRPVGLVLLAVALLLVSGCGYERHVTRREQRGVHEPSPDPERYGSIRMIWVKEIRRPTGWRTFPDGGKPLELAYYAIVYQSGEGLQEREIARIHLSPVRWKDYGDLIGGQREWRAPDRLWYQVRYGYYQREQTAEGEILLPPLK